MLYGEIPEPDLNNCYLRAYREHKPGFPMECAEILRSWYIKKAQLAPNLSQSAFCALCKAHNENSTLPLCPFHKDVYLAETTFADNSLKPEVAVACLQCGVCLSLTAEDIEAVVVAEQKQSETRLRCPACCRLTLPYGADFAKS